MAVNKQIILGIVAAINEHGMSMTDVANKLGINMEDARSWLKLNSEPPKEMVDRIMKFLEHPESEEKFPETKEKKSVSKNSSEKKTEKIEDSMAPPVPSNNVLEEKVKASEKKVKTTKTDNKKETPEKVPPTTQKKRVPTMSTKEKKPINKQQNVANKFFRDATETLIRNEIGIKKTDTLTAESVAMAGKNIADQIMKNISDLLSITQDTTQEAFREPDPLPEKIQKLLDAAEAASDEGIEMATTILKKFAK